MTPVAARIVLDIACVATIKHVPAHFASHRLLCALYWKFHVL